MRRLLILALLAIGPAAFAQSTPKEADILIAENLFWTNYTSANTTELAKQLAPGFQNIEEEVWTGPQVLDFVSGFFKQCTLAPVKILTPKVTFLAPTIATITYHAIESPRCGGKSMSGDISVAGVPTHVEAKPGPNLLRQSAVDAIKKWRYKPYLLNGQAVAVETTVTINFGVRA